MELRPPAVVGPERELSGEEERASPHLAPPAPPAAGQQAPSDRQEGQLTEGEGTVVKESEKFRKITLNLWSTNRRRLSLCPSLNLSVGGAPGLPS